MKKLVMMLFAIICFSAASAQKVSNSHAKRAAEMFWAKSVENGNAAAQLQYCMLEDNDTLIYVYNIGNTGFVVVSGDYKCNPVFGYSDEGNFNTDQAPAFKNWMQSYAGKVAVQRKSKSSNVNPAWTEVLANTNLVQLKQNTKIVAPLLTTRWDQGKYYNHMCPLYATGPDGHCVTGCVATAMAQVMKYYNWPAQGMGSHSYVHPHFGTIAADFSATTYDWATMGNSGSTANQDAIGTLIFHCGVSVNMDYTPIESGAQTVNAASALENYFHYRNTIDVIDRSSYSYYDWIAILKDNLDMHHPMIYSGSGSGGGHAWVCDGYDANNYFHMNWGWSGSDNGYFQVDTLNAGGYDFSSYESVIVNIIPYFAPYCMNGRVFTDSTRVMEDGSGYSYYWNDTDCDWLIKPAGAEAVVLQFADFNTESGNDVVSVYDGETTAAPLLGAFSGTDTPPVLTATSGKMLITFSSNATVQGLGWSAKYWALKHGAGINENQMGSVALYPNPVVNQLNFVNQTDGNEPIAIAIYDGLGKQVYQTWQVMPKGVSNSIDMSGFDAGFYIISFQSANYNYRAKFIKQ